MSTVGQPERATQKRVAALFRDELGYRHLGDWADRSGNSNVEEKLLTAWLTKNGNTQAQISTALYKLRTEADNHNRSLYDNNQAVYNLLRYGVPVKIEAGKEYRQKWVEAGYHKRMGTAWVCLPPDTTPKTRRQRLKLKRVSPFTLRSLQRTFETRNWHGVSFAETTHSVSTTCNPDAWG